MFVQNRDFFMPVLSERGCACAAPLITGRCCQHGHMPFTEEILNLENLIFSRCIGGCEAFSSIGILTESGLIRIRYFPDSIV